MVRIVSRVAGLINNKNAFSAFKRPANRRVIISTIFTRSVCWFNAAARSTACITMDDPFSCSSLTDSPRRKPALFKNSINSSPIRFLHSNPAAVNQKITAWLMWPMFFNSSLVDLIAAALPGLKKHIPDRTFARVA